MSEKNQPRTDFASLFPDAKRITSDKIDTLQHKKDFSKSEKFKAASKHHSSQQQATYEVSDEFEAHWPDDVATKYINKEVINDVRGGKDLLKQLKMANIPPDAELDLHGYTAKGAKQEVLSFIYAAKKNHWHCINIVHGHGNGTLKRKIPNWLVQINDVSGFIQAPKAYGGQAGLLVLIDLSSPNKLI